MPLLPVSQLERMTPLFKGKAGNAFASLLRKLFSVSRLSDLYDECCHLQGPDFAAAVIKRLGIKLEIGDAFRLNELPESPFITVSNHPYGGMDGIILLDLIGHQREGFKVMVNEFLDLIEPFRQSWITVNPKNNDSNGVTQKNIQGVKEVFQTLRNGKPVGFFPSGAVSDFSIKELRIRDRQWQEPLIRLIRKARVPIVPIRFLDRNSAFFYFLGLINWKIRTLRLPKEVINKEGSTIRVAVGETISVARQDQHKDFKGFRDLMRNSVYEMPVPETFTGYEDFLLKSR